MRRVSMPSLAQSTGSLGYSTTFTVNGEGDILRWEGGDTIWISRHGLPTRYELALVMRMSQMESPCLIALRKELK